MLLFFLETLIGITYIYLQSYCLGGPKPIAIPSYFSGINMRGSRGNLRGLNNDNMII